MRAIKFRGKRTDEQIQTMVEWAIKKDYEYDTDIPENEVIDILNL